MGTLNLTSSRRSQRGFVSPFVDFLFGAFGSFLVIAIIMLALTSVTAETPVTGFILVEFEEPNECTVPGKVKYGVALATPLETFWADGSHPGLRFVPSALSTDRQLIIFNGFSPTEEITLHVYLAEMPLACQNRSYALALKKPGNAKQRIVLRRGGANDIHKTCTLLEDSRLLCP